MLLFAEAYPGFTAGACEMRIEKNKKKKKKKDEFKHVMLENVGGGGVTIIHYNAG